MLRLYSSAGKFDTVFTVLLFMLFAFTAGLLVLIGVRQYRVSAGQMDKNYEVRTASSYLTEKIHQYDSSSGIFTMDGALVFAEDIGDGAYYTYIYYYDGALCELLTAADADFIPEAGQKILDLGGFYAQQMPDGLFVIQFTDSDGCLHREYLHAHAAAHG